MAQTATPAASAPRILATSADGAWQVSSAKAGEVTLTPLKQPTQLATLPAATFTNPRYTFLGDQYETWSASRAAFSPSNKYAVVQWTDDVPKYTSSQLDIITLSGYRRQELPLSDLRNSLEMPTWSSDENHLAASGGNSVRLWTLSPYITVKLIDPPAVKGQRLSYSTALQFSGDSKRLAVNYSLIASNNYPDKTRQLQAIFSVPEGKLLSTKVIPTPQH